MIASFDAARSWLDGELARLSYVSDAWEFTVAGNPIDGLMIQVRWTFTSRHNDDKTITFRQYVDADAIASRRDLASLHRRVLAAIAKMESHERLEWFHRDGQPIYDPHPDGPNIPRFSPL